MDRSEYDKIRGYLGSDVDSPADESMRARLSEAEIDAEAQRALKDFWDGLPEGGLPIESTMAFENFCRMVGDAMAPRPKRSTVIFRWIRNVAAALLIPVALLCAVLSERPKTNDVEWCEYIVEAGCTDSLILPDSSRIWLNAGSHLIYPKSFEGSAARKVFLTGEGYFDVAHDPEHPFIVGASDINVRVHGTQFNITSYENMEAISVCLMEGSISLDVEKNGIRRNVMLVPGDVARYDKSTGDLEQRRMQTDAYLSWRNGGFYFNNQSLSEIVAQFERVYGVEIHIADKSVASMAYTLAFVNNESLDMMLNAIAGYELKVENTSDVIIISRK